MLTPLEFFSVYEREVNTLLHLMAKAQNQDLNWRPRPDMMSLGQVMHHLSDSFANALHCLQTGQWPDMSGGLPSVDQIPAVASTAAAIAALEKDRPLTRDFLSSMSPEDFLNREAAVPWGDKGPFWRLAWTFIEHLQMHKMQLFLYLRLLGLPLNTMDLYAVGP